MSLDAQARMQNQQGLMGQRQNMADYKQQEFQINKLNPYYENIARNEALTGALFQNVNNAVGMGASVGMNGMGGKSKMPKIKLPTAAEQWQSDYNNQNYDTTY